MKYFSHLDAVETHIVRLGELVKLYKVVGNGVEYSNADEIRSAVHYMEGSLVDIHENLTKNFQELWDHIAEKSEKKERHDK